MTFLDRNWLNLSVRNKLRETFRHLPTAAQEGYHDAACDHDEYGTDINPRMLRVVKRHRRRRWQGRRRRVDEPFATARFAH